MGHNTTYRCREAHGAAATGAAPAARPVLLIAPYTPGGGGMGRMMAYLAEEPSGAARFIMVESRGAGSALMSAWPMLKAAWRIVIMARRAPGTIVHVNMAEGGSVLRKGLLVILARILRLDTVLHLHAACITDFYERAGRLTRLFTRCVFQAAQVCIVLGEAWRAWLQNTVHVDGARIVVLPNGVPAPDIVPFRAGVLPPTLVFLGNLHPRKGLPDLLTALGTERLRKREWTLIVAGGGDAKTLREQASELGIDDRVAFAGWLCRGDCTALLARASMLVLPSYHEGLPLVLLEAASLGVPSITTRVGAIAEVFTDEQNTLLVEPGNIRALADALVRLIDDPALRAHIGQGARALYSRALTMEIFRRNLLGIYARHCTKSARYAQQEARKHFFLKKEAKTFAP